MQSEPPSLPSRSRDAAGEISYARRTPEESALYGVVREQLETFLGRARERDRPAPCFVERELRAYLACGILAHGFLRVHGDACGCDRLVAFSCKSRGICPSCGGRRMADTAAHLVDRVSPEVPIRQWVLSLPIPLRYRPGYGARLTRDTLQLVVRAVFASLRRRARKRRKLDDTQCGAVSFVQRFGGALNLNVHFHILVIDGVYAAGDTGGLRFYPLPAPSHIEVERMTPRVARRLARLLERLCRYVARPPIASERLSRLSDGRLLYRLRRRWRDGTTHPVFAPLELIEKLAALIPPPRFHVVRYHGVLAPSARARHRIVPEATRAWRRSDLDYHASHCPKGETEGDSETVHAARRHAAHLAGSRSVQTPDHAAAWVSSGSTCLSTDARDPLRATVRSDDENARRRPRRTAWAELMRRVFAPDVLECLRCGGAMRILAEIHPPDATRAVLGCLKLPSRAPPTAAPEAEPDAESVTHFDFEFDSAAEE